MANNKARWLRLDSLCNIIISSVDKKSKETEAIVRLCNFTDVYKNWALYEENYNSFMIATASTKDIERLSIKEGDVCITKDSETRDDIGMSTYIATDYSDVVLGYHCALLRPKKEVDIYGPYLKTYLASYLGRKYFSQQSSGSGQRYTLTIESISAIKVPVISFEEQKKIGDFFLNLDRQIHCNNLSSQTLEETAKTLYDYWFTQFDFPNEEGKPYRSSGGKMVWNEELKREIPEGWEVKTLDKFSRNIITGKTPSCDDPENFGGDIPFITIDDIRGNIFVLSTIRTLSLKGANTQKNKFLPKNSLCVSCIGTTGLIGFSGEKSSQTNQQINSIIFDKNEYKEFLYFSLKQFFKVSKAKTGNIFANMNKKEFSEINTINPPSEILQKYHAIASNVFQKINNLAHATNKLSSLRDYLLPLLMNGQVTIED